MLGCEDDEPTGEAKAGLGKKWGNDAACTEVRAVGCGSDKGGWKLVTISIMINIKWNNRVHILLYHAKKNKYDALRYTIPSLDLTTTINNKLVLIN